MQIQTCNLGQRQFVDSSSTSKESKEKGWKTVTPKTPNKIYELNGSSYKVVKKLERHLPLCSTKRIGLIALGILCTLITFGTAPFLCKFIRQLFSGRQVRRVVEKILVANVDAQPVNQPVKPVEVTNLKQKAIVYMSITGHPTHLGHMAAVSEAIARLEKEYHVTNGYVSLGSQEYLKGKVKKDDPCLTLEQRKTILIQTIQEASSRNMFRGVPVQYTELEQELSDHPFVYEKLQQDNKDQEVVFVCGPDLYPKTAKGFKNVIVLGREEMPPPEGMKPNHSYIIPSLYPQYSGLSSTKLRNGKASLEPQSLDETFRAWYK
jgi:hypothetical protein